MRKRVLAALFAVATGAPGPWTATPASAAAVQASPADCACVAGRFDSDAEVARCTQLLDRMSPAEVTNLKGQCNAQSAPAQGIDVCFCLKTFHTDPQVIQACEALLGKNTKPSELARMGADCR
ncbi:MAG: hypothetical protein KDG52_02425 [Rhodocyclaceae bacterium]|nr:hypothetical protein [Rhodocyclaceae bacterium]